MLIILIQWKAEKGVNDFRLPSIKSFYFGPVPKQNVFSSLKRKIHVGNTRDKIFPRNKFVSALNMHNGSVCKKCNKFHFTSLPRL